MEIVILSTNKALEKSLLPVLDEIICKNRMRNLTLFSDSVFPPDPSELLPFGHVFYFLLDINGLENPSVTCRRIQHNFPSGLLGIISNNDAESCRLQNRLFPSFGNLNLTNADWKDELQVLLRALNQRIFRADSSLLITCQKERLIVPYQEIYYIETLKGSHYCCIYKKDRITHKIRANVKDLLSLMDERFFLVRSSTIVNLSHVTQLSQKDRLLYFNSGLNCQYAQANYPKIVERLKALRT